MYFQYETNRLILRILNSHDAKKVLQFQVENRELFEKYEPDRPENFYTLSHQESLLRFEYKLAMKLSTVRFYVFLKNDPAKVIGTVCFHNITRPFYSCTEVGYKFAASAHHQGYATEALQKGIEIMRDELGIHRINARVMPVNLPSIHLLERLGFEREGLERESIFLHGVWEDHLRFGLITTHPWHDTSSQTD